MSAVALAVALNVGAIARAQPPADTVEPTPGAPTEPTTEAPDGAAPAAPPAPVGPATQGSQQPATLSAQQQPGPESPLQPAAPPAQSFAPPPSLTPTTDQVNEDPTVLGNEQSSTRFYFALTAFGTLYAHAAVYEIDAGDETSQLSAGLGYELVGLLGGVGEKLAIGAAVDFLNVPRAVVSYRGGSVPGTTLAASEIPDLEHNMWFLTLGPGVDYRPGQAFRIGGTVGVAVARVPKFAHPPHGSNTVGGFGSTLWLGADWPTGDHTRFGLLIKGGVHQYIPRNLEAAIDPYAGSEASLSLGVGAGLSFL